jgi:hypothetical protein
MQKHPRKLFVWSISHGLLDAAGRPVAKEDTRRPEQALAFIAGYQEGTLFLFKDFHPYLKDNTPNASLLIRLLRELVPELEELVINALYEAFSSPARELRTEHLLRAAREIEAMRQWAATHCRLAAESEKDAPETADSLTDRRVRMVDLEPDDPLWRGRRFRAWWGRFPIVSG